MPVEGPRVRSRAFSFARNYGRLAAFIPRTGRLPMPIFGTRSTDIMANVHPDLVKVLNEAIKTMDFSLTCGQRGRAAQEKAKAEGNSNAHFGQSPHNFDPALAIDFIPYPFTNDMWNDTAKFETIARHIQRAGIGVGVKCDWGGDWHSIKDYPHIELSNWKEIKGDLAE